MPVKRRTDKRRSELTEDEADWLRGGDGGHDQKYFSTSDDLAALWREFADDIVKEHIATSPGTRPERWWSYSAPEPRRRLGGIGTPCHERLAHVLRLQLGVPVDWIMADDVSTYELIGSPLEVPALDPAKPPMYESEAAYLQRLELLQPGERKRLTPKDFNRQSVIDILGIEFEEDSEG
jgi:hypothetical protein